MRSIDIRRSFLSFFEAKGHLVMPSSSLIPAGDPTLLLTSAGMVQFKPYFTGEMLPPSPRLTSVQKCFRGTDIDEVGDTSHNTFFEMLGNFSIGDYSKYEAILWAWEYVTKDLKLSPEKLWVTIFLEDKEAYDLWVKTGIPEEKIWRFGEKDNWWGPAGNEGPCGPCSEIHYDFGGNCRIGKPYKECGPNCECGRFLELWNLVFMQFYQGIDGNRTPLPSPNIDTGMGLERAASILQNAPSIYETDLFKPIIAKVEKLAGVDYGNDNSTDVSIRVVAEHVRSAVFLIADGVVPGNEGRGYVLRRLIRRAIRYSRKLGLDSFLVPIAGVVINHMGDYYEELRSGEKFILHVLNQEEESFGEVYDVGMRVIDEYIKTQLVGEEISGKELFLLYDTYGFPVEETTEIAKDLGFSVDREGFKAEMEAQRIRSRAEGKNFGADLKQNRLYENFNQTVFLGYETTEASSEVLGLMMGDKHVDIASEGSEIGIILRETPFYAEAGGQVGDSGHIEGQNGTIQIDDTRAPISNLIVHVGRVLKGVVRKGETVVATVDYEQRQNAARNHTATHLLHAALRRVLGKHVRQAGSLVTPDRLRFDFTHVNSLTAEELQSIERLVNAKIRENIEVKKRETTFRQATAEGALAFFGDKYSDQVRVVEVSNGDVFSFEVCGGTHVRATGDVGYIRVVSESSIGAGMRRLEAVSGPVAESFAREQSDLLGRISNQLETSPGELGNRVANLMEEVIRLRKVVTLVQREESLKVAQDLLDKVKEFNGIKVVAGKVKVSSADLLRGMGDWLRDKIGNGIIVLGGVINERPVIIAMVTTGLVEKGFHAGEIVKKAASVMGGGGGGRAEIAQAGGRDPKALDDALRIAVDLIRDQKGQP